MNANSFCQKILISLGFLAASAACDLVICSRTAVASPARFWISTSDQSTAGPDAPPPTINLKIGTTQTIYVWAQPMTDSGNFKNLQNLSLNLTPEQSDAAVYDILDTFQIYEAGGSRFQPQFIRDSDSAAFPIASTSNEAAVMGGSLDSIVGLSAGLAQTASFVGIGLDQPGDNGNAAVKAWRIASIELRGIMDSGVARLHLQIGSLGMNHAGELSIDTSVIFGSPGDPIYNAKDHREMTFPNEFSSLIDSPDLIVNGVLNLQPGDFDSDRDVDGADFVAWQTNFPKASGGTLATGDADGDGDVDGADFVVWQTNFPYTPGSATSPVPEPVSWILIAPTAIAFAGARTRPKRGFGNRRVPHRPNAIYSSSSAIKFPLWRRWSKQSRQMRPASMSSHRFCDCISPAIPLMNRFAPHSLTHSRGRGSKSSRMIDSLQMHDGMD